MRAFGLLLAGALCTWTAAASAGPGADALLSAQAAPLIDVHHKPGHKGGPPWARRNQERDEWRSSRDYSRGYNDGYAQRRTVCRTTYRTYYDDYVGDYVRRSVRVCD